MEQHCVSEGNPTQLILPESVKFVPAFVLGFLKLPLFRSLSDVHISLLFNYTHIHTYNLSLSLSLFLFAL
jgi:hypothetical protein